MNLLEQQKSNYLEMLKDCFSPEIVPLLLDEDTLEIKRDVKNLLDNNKLKPNGCKDCPLNVERKVMDFPGWLGKINLKEKHRKEIMVIGFSPSNAVSIPVHIAFGLGYDYRSTEDLDALDYNAQRFWKAMDFLFNNGLDYFNNNAYVTDLAYCNCPSGDTDTLDFCSKKHLLNEINFINPKLIILNGYGVKKYLNFLPKPSISIPHSTSGQTKYNFNYNNPSNSNKRWIEARDNISNFLLRT